MQGPLYFPHEHFEKIMCEPKVRQRIQIASQSGIDARQPNLFSKKQWERIFRGLGKNTILNSVLTSWGYSKTVYHCNQVLLDQLAVANIEAVEDNPEILYNLPHGCAYIEGQGLWPDCLNVQGTWVTVIKGRFRLGQIIWVMNTINGIIVVDLEFDSSGMYETLEGTVEMSLSYFNGLVDDPDVSLGKQWTKSIADNCTFIFYLCSSNADIEPVNGNRHTSYMVDDRQRLMEPPEIHFYNVGQNIDVRDTRAFHFDKKGMACTWHRYSKDNRI